MPTQIDVFISSKMQELKGERQALYELLADISIADIRPHAWVYEEDAPASDKSIREVYLEVLYNSALYIGLFWHQYGEWTIDEFERATQSGIERHVYEKTPKPGKRDERLTQFLRAQSPVATGVTTRRFTTVDELCEGVEQSLRHWIQQRFLSHPGDSTAILARYPVDVPDQPAKLVGRDAALTTIETLLRDRDRVLLHGLGGVGKTALAAGFLTHWIQAGKGPALWLRVGSNSAEQVYQALARPFGQKESMSSAVHASREREQLRTLLAKSGATLLVFDDVWWNRQALREVLQAVPGDIPVLATSRQRFSDVNAIYDVSDLDPSDALELLSHHANRDCRHEDAAAEVCAQLSGHPFSIERAGKLLERREWSASTLLERLRKDEPQNLEIPDYGSKERSSVKVMLDTTLEALDKKERALFRALGHFFAPVATAEMLQLHVGEAQKVGPSLDELHDWGLLRYVRETATRAAHYRLHDLAFSYARAHASEQHRVQALDTLLAYSRSHRTPGTPDVAAVLPVLENFMGAVKYAMGVERFRDVEEIVWNLHTKQQLSQYHGFYSECIALLQEAACAARNVGDGEHEGAYVGNIGKLYSLTGRFEEALDYQKRALEIAIQARDHQGIAIDTSNLGEVCSQLGRHAEAIEYGQRGLSIIRETEDVRHECILLRYLGISHHRAGNHKDAQACFMEALEISRRESDRHQEHYILSCLGELAARQRQFGESVDHFTRSLSIAEDLPDPMGKADNLLSLGCVHLRWGKNERSLPYFNKAADAMREVANQLGEADAHFNKGVAFANLRRYQEAVASYGRALAISRDIGDRDLELRARDALEDAVWNSKTRMISDDPYSGNRTRGHR